MEMMAVYAVIARARFNPFTTKSAFAREAANEIALCASEGFITSKLDDTTFSNVWIVTGAGIEFLEMMNDVLSSD